MTHQEAKELLERYEQGKCTRQEMKFLDAWYVHQKNAQEDLDLDEATIQQDLAQAWQRISVQKSTSRSAIRRLLNRWAATAAVFILVGAATFWFMNSNRFNRDGLEKGNGTAATYSVKQSQNDIQPAYPHAYLTLSDGKKIRLDKESSGILTQGDDVHIEIMENGQVAYHAPEGESMNLDIPTNTIDIPKGALYTLQLPDGTTVSLNAGSSLTYPIRFTSDKREVTLKGEAFFHVSQSTLVRNGQKLKRAFIVHTERSNIRVLGTQFNVKSYPTDKMDKTTLTEGSVAIENKSIDHQPLVLNPGQQAIVNASSTKMREVNVAREVGWKNGDFVFNGDPIEEVMNQLSRWYDVEIKYAGSIPQDVTLISTISRRKTLKQVLEILESTTNLNFMIETEKERRIMVIP